MSEEKPTTGRPTEYSQEKLDLAELYISGGWEVEGDTVPQVAGLAIALGISRETVYTWAKDPEKKAFSDILTRVQSAQERKLVNGGLSNLFNPAITKMMLTKHGYSDKQEIDLSSTDGSMATQGRKLEDFYAAGEDVPAQSGT